MNNGTSSSESATRGWTASPDERGTIDIITSCFLTIILCCWTAVCPNIPSLSDTAIDHFRDKLNLACIALLGPDFLFCIAVGQRSSAARSVEKFRANGYVRWTLTHSFYADMGGFLLCTPDLERPIALNSEQLFYLVNMGYIEYPNIEKDDIDDRNKTDGLARLLTIGQALWFVASSVSRPIQGLALTTLELTTLSFILIMLATSYCWMHKPSGVTRPVLLRCQSSIEQIRTEAGCQPDSLYHRTPLDFLRPEEYTLNLIWSYFVNILRHLNIPLFARPVKHIPYDRIPDDIFLAVEPRFEVFLLFFVLSFSAIFMLAWNFHFPTATEQILWRSASIYILVFGFWGSLTIGVWDRFLLERKRAARKLSMNEVASSKQRCQHQSTQGRFESLKEVLRNNSLDNDPAFNTPLSLIIPVSVACAIYAMCRGYILLEDLLTLRRLPETAYITVGWSKYLPHI